LISGIISKKGNPGKILEYLRKSEFRLVISKKLIDEFIEVSHRPKIMNKYKISEYEIENLIKNMYEFGEVVAVESKISKSIDVKDNCFLECAFIGKADYLISGDSDLLNLKFFYNTDIITPARFIKIIEHK